MNLAVAKNSITQKGLGSESMAKTTASMSSSSWSGPDRFSDLIDLLLGWWLDPVVTEHQRCDIVDWIIG